MSIADLTPQRYPALWRWIIERVWRVEHAFERAHADGRAENDTRIRIFVVMSLFAVGFVVINFLVDVLYTVLDPRIRHA